MLISELGAVPINAGRNSGSVEADEGEGDPGFGVCDDAKPASTSETKNKKTAIRMGT